MDKDKLKKEQQALLVRQRIDDLEKQEDDVLVELRALHEGIGELEILQAQHDRIAASVGESPLTGNKELIQRLFALCDEQLEETHAKLVSIRSERDGLNADYLALQRS